MAQQEQPRLLIKRESAKTVVMSLESPVYEPLWKDVMWCVAQIAFAGRDISFITFEPPLWDVELTELAQHITTITYGSEKFAVAFAPAVEQEILRRAVNSTDFKLRVLIIAAIPATVPERIENFLAALSQRSQLDTIDTSEEFMECIDDQWLYWSNAPATALLRCVETLNMFASKQGWRTEIDLT